MKFFRYGGTTFRFLTSLCDLILLNLLWFVTSIPMVTMGASTAALYTITLKMARGEEGYVVKGFLTAFKRNFKRATIIWILMVVTAGWFALFFWLMHLQNSDFGRALQLLEAAIVIFVLLAALYVMPILARYENTMKNTVQNAFFLSLKYLPYSFLMLTLIAAPVLLTAFAENFFNLMMSLWISVGVSAIALGNSHVVNRVFKKIEEGGAT